MAQKKRDSLLLFAKHGSCHTSFVRLAWVKSAPGFNGLTVKDRLSPWQE